MAVALFYNTDQKERQDLMLLNPSSLTPINNLDKNVENIVAKNSPLMDSKVVKHLLEVLKKSETGADTSKASIATLKFK
jgi:hypothetical protein